MGMCIIPADRVGVISLFTTDVVIDLLLLLLLLPLLLLVLLRIQIPPRQ